ncbi:MAG: hypothetical protein GY705_31770 [Bacteroidetes bacterium]|nr:hypothetical protein [Bacteroidota bacterium]
MPAPVESQKTDTHQYFAPLTDGEISDRNGCDPIVIPAGSVDALADAIAEICENGVIYLEGGMHTENEAVTITKSVKIIGKEGAVLKVFSELAPYDDAGLQNVFPGLHILNAPNTLIQDVTILPVDPDGGTAILIENSHGAAVMRCEIIAASPHHAAGLKTSEFKCLGGGFRCSSKIYS